MISNSERLGQSRALSLRLAFLCAFVAIVVGAAAFRLPALDARPMHGDEANQAYKTGRLIETGEYRYDPSEHHGPTLYYATLPVAWLTGVRSFAASTESTYRIVPVIFGVATILLLCAFVDAMGAWVVLMAAALMAISPALVYYSRYYIQESLLAFFTLAALGCGWRYVRHRSAFWAACTGLSLGLMHATKETCVLAWGAAGAALLLTWLWQRRGGEASVEGGEAAEATATGKIRIHLLIGAVAVGLASALFFSSFFTHPSGVWDSIRAYTFYVSHADGNGTAGVHNKPFYYFLWVLAFIKRGSFWWGEGLILGLALVGGGVALFKKGPREIRAFRRFLVIYTLLLTALYSAIPYKTPWCLINFLQPMCVLAGLGAVSIIQWGRWLPMRALIVIALLVGGYNLAWQAHRASFVAPADVRNPYAYAHPVIGAKEVAARAQELAAVHPAGRNLLIHVIMPGGDYWPLPWYLRRFTNVGYWSVPKDPADADFIVTSPTLESELAPKLHDSYETEGYTLRMKVPMKAYINQQLWDAFMATRP